VVLDAIEAAVLGAAPGLLTLGARTIAEIARTKAPVRRIFEGDTRIIATRSVGDTQTLSNRVVVGHTVRYPHLLSQRRIVDEGEVIGQDYLSRRGRYEVRSGRANYRPRGRATQVGGRLKGEIRGEPATIEGRVVSSRVVSPTPYAKHQEFGNRHNPAHPYMRPAAAEGRPVVTSQITEGLLSAGNAAARGGQRVAEIRAKLIAEVS
jgi:hypothetical protein